MKKITLITALAALIACNHKNDFDASGNFIADEVIVSAEQNGRLIDYTVQEGQTLNEGQKVGQINVEVLKLQKQQVEATIASLKEKTLAFGDSFNDEEMLLWANVGVAVGNAIPYIKEKADIVAKPIWEDGIYLTLKDLGMI